MSTARWQKLLLPAELRNSGNKLLSTATNPKIHLLRTGGVFRSDGSQQTINAGATANIELQHPGMLRDEDVVYPLVLAEGGGPSADTNHPLKLLADPAFSPASKTWTVDVENMGGSIVELHPNDYFVLQHNPNPAPATSPYLTHSPTELGTPTSNAAIGLTTFARAETNLPASAADIYLSADAPWPTYGATYIPGVRAQSPTHVSVRDFGARGDGATDDTLAIQRALDYVGGVHGGGVVRLPAGTYKLTATLHAHRYTMLLGDGVDVSTLIASSANPRMESTMIEALGTTDGTGVGFMDFLELHHLTLNGNGAATTGVHLTGARLCSFLSCHFTAFHGKHVHAQQLWDTRFDTCYFTDGDPAANAPFIHITGGGLDPNGNVLGYSNGVLFHNCRIGSYYFTPVLLDGSGGGDFSNNLFYFTATQWESPYRSVTLLSVNHMVLIHLIACSLSQIPSSSALVVPTVSIQDSSNIMLTETHSQYNPIWIPFHAPVPIALGDTTPTVLFPTYLDDLHLSHLEATNTVPTTITFFDDGVANQVIYVAFTNGNTTLFNGSGIQLIGGSSVTYAANAMARLVFNGTTWVETYLMTFVQGDTTPSVANGSYFVANNTSPTTITNFDDGLDGQTITIRFATANTTIPYNANIHLTAGAQFTPAAGDIMRFRFNNGVWTEDCRAGLIEGPLLDLTNVSGLTISGGTITRNQVSDPPIVVKAGDSKAFAIKGFNIIAAYGVWPLLEAWKPQPQFNLISYEGGVDSYRQNAVSETLYLGAYEREPYLSIERVASQPPHSLTDLQNRWFLGRITASGAFRVLHSADQQPDPLQAPTTLERVALSIAKEDLGLQLGGRLIGAGDGSGALLAFSNGDATPSVGAANGFRTVNTSSTTITALDDGRVGQVVTILFDDGLTTVQNSSTLRLNGAVNFVGRQHDTLTLLSAGATWYEIARMRHTP